MRQGEESGPGPEDREGATRELRQGMTGHAAWSRNTFRGSGPRWRWGCPSAPRCCSRTTETRSP